MPPSKKARTLLSRMGRLMKRAVGEATYIKDDKSERDGEELGIVEMAESAQGLATTVGMLDECWQKLKLELKHGRRHAVAKVP